MRAGAPTLKALGAYGLVLRAAEAPEEVYPHVVAGRSVSDITTGFLAWCPNRVDLRGRTARLLTGDHA